MRGVVRTVAVYANHARCRKRSLTSVRRTAASHLLYELGRSCGVACAVRAIQNYYYYCLYNVPLYERV